MDTPSNRLPDLLALLRQLLAEVSGIGAEHITDDTRIADLVRDSLALFELTAALEEDRSIHLPDADFEAAHLQELTVRELANLLEHARPDGEP